MLVEIVADPALTDLVVPVLGVETDDFLSVATRSEIKREEVTLLCGAIGIDECAGFAQFGVARLIEDGCVSKLICSFQWGLEKELDEFRKLYDAKKVEIVPQGTLAERLRAAGAGSVAIDPGFGFGKTLAHNYALLDGLGALATLQVPLLVGVSRKSMIYKRLNCAPAAALNGTTALHAWALERGAHILLAHDVAEAAECVKLHRAMKMSRLHSTND